MRASIASFALLAACGAAPCPGDQGPGAQGPDAPATAATSGGNDQGVSAEAAGAAPAVVAPSGFVAATVQAVIPTPQGNALLLAEPGGARVVPVMIGEAEAMVIDLRLRGERFERPLTHDLLDTIVRELGGTVVMVQVDKLRTGVFIGSVLVWDGSAMHRIDARTSDAVAVALGHGVPIYVSTAVFDEAGISR